MNQNTAPSPSVATLDVAALAAELAQVQENKKAWEDREKQLKAALRALGVGKHPAGNLSVSVSPNRRLDEDRVRASYPPEQWPGFYVQKVATTVVRDSIPPAVYDQFMIESGDPIVRVS